MSTSRKKTGCIPVMLLAAVILFFAGSDAQKAEAKTVKASVAAKQLIVGKQLSIQTKTQQVRYQSSDTPLPPSAIRG